MLSSVTWGTWEQLCTAASAEEAQPDAQHKPTTAIAQKKAFEKVIDVLRAELGEEGPRYTMLVEDDKEDGAVHWTQMHESILPEGAGLPASRCARKKQQIEYMIGCFEVVLSMYTFRRPSGADERPIRVVEFCAGCGYVALPLAARHPAVEFVCVDMKPKSIEVLEQRIQQAGLKNVTALCARVEDFELDGGFDIGMCLHACGAATDLSMEKCLEARAAYVMCPCCVGKVRFAASDGTWDGYGPLLTYPRSQRYHTILSLDQYLRLAKAADFGHDNYASFSAVNRSRRVSKSYLEHDRNTRAEEAGYATGMLVIDPRAASPKNDVIVGWPAHMTSTPFRFDGSCQRIEQHIFEECACASRR